MNENTTEKRIDNTIFIVTSACSNDATETVEQKLERLICRHVSDAKCYQPERDLSLASRGIVRENGGDNI